MKRTFCDNCDVEITEGFDPYPRVALQWQDRDSRAHVESKDLCRPCFQKVVETFRGRA